MSDLLTRFKAFAEKSEAKPQTPIEDRWALQDKLQNAQQSTASRSAGHKLRNGICVTCGP